MGFLKFMPSGCLFLKSNISDLGQILKYLLRLRTHAYVIIALVFWSELLVLARLQSNPAICALQEKNWNFGGRGEFFEVFPMNTSMNSPKIRKFQKSIQTHILLVHGWLRRVANHAVLIIFVHMKYDHTSFITFFPDEIFPVLRTHCPIT